MLRTLALVSMIALAGCASTYPAGQFRTESLTPAETEQVDSILEKLYRSFSYGDGEEPDWELMRSIFVDGAQFVAETPIGEAPNPQSVDAFISNWQASIRNNTSPTIGKDEWITDTRITKVGKLIRVDVMFQAKKRNDPAPRKPGLDSLVLVDVGDALKIQSFVVHYESKL